MATTVTDRFGESPQSLWPRGRVRVATTGNITLSTALDAGDTIDGVTLATGDLVLVKSQTSQAENGIYRCGDGGTRAPNFQTFNDIAGILVYVMEGTTNGDTTWICSANYGGTLGTTALPFSQFDGGSALGALANDTGYFLVGTGTGFQSVAPATARTSMGAQAQDAALDEIAALTPQGTRVLITDTGKHVTLAALGAGLVITDSGIAADLGRVSEWVPAGSMRSEVADGPTWGLNEMSTNKNLLASWDFDDTGQQFAQFDWDMPGWWNRGTLSYRYRWSHAVDTGAAAGANAVVFRLQAVAYQNASPADVAFGTAISITDAGDSGNVVYESDESAALTVAGTLTGRPLVQFRLSRNAADAADTMTANARLHGLSLYYTQASLKDT